MAPLRPVVDGDGLAGNPGIHRSLDSVTGVVRMSCARGRRARAG
jgi:hypothetical protein